MGLKFEREVRFSFLGIIAMEEYYFKEEEKFPPLKKKKNNSFKKIKVADELAG